MISGVLPLSSSSCQLGFAPAARASTMTARLRACAARYSSRSGPSLLRSSKDVVLRVSWSASGSLVEDSESASISMATQGKYAYISTLPDKLSRQEDQRKRNPDYNLQFSNEIYSVERTPQITSPSFSLLCRMLLNFSKLHRFWSHRGMCLASEGHKYLPLMSICG